MTCNKAAGIICFILRGAFVAVSRHVGVRKDRRMGGTGNQRFNGVRGKSVNWKNGITRSIYSRTYERLQALHVQKSVDVICLLPQYIGVKPPLDFYSILMLRLLVRLLAYSGPPHHAQVHRKLHFITMLVHTISTSITGHTMVSSLR